jgi:hypothetical protein
MRSYTLKNIPEDLYHMAERSAKANFRSLNQELLWRVQQTFDMEEAAAAGLHQTWVNEALESGPAKAAAPADWENALKRGLAKARRGK